jgi:uracil-DNA glycosylase
MRLSLYKEFADKWSRGCGSELCAKANKIVLAKGKVPCDILICGEGPGESENVIGVPFCGPAGQLLERQVVAKAVPKELRIAYTNLVACVPRDEDGAKTIEPCNEDIESCKFRLEEFIEIAKPKLIVCVGKLASDWFEQGYKHSIQIPDGTVLCSITHPAAILRSNVTQRGLMIQRCVVTLQNVVEEVFPNIGG